MNKYVVETKRIHWMLYWELARNTTLSNVTVSVWFDMNSSQRNEKKNQQHSYHPLEIPNSMHRTVQQQENR